MEEHSELFLLLPESETSMRTSAFLTFKQKKGKDEFEKIIEGIGKVHDFFDYECCLMLYDSLNRDAFDSLLQEVDVSDEYPNLSQTFVVFISEWDDWRDAPEQLEEDEYVLESSPILNDSFCEVVKRVDLHSTNTYLLLNATDYTPKDQRACLGCKSQGIMHDHDVDVCKLDIKDIYVWFGNNRRPIRSYLSNKKKHGEEGKGGRKRQKNGDSVGRLLCKDEEAEKMLHMAIGKSPLCTKLFCYDEEREKYVQFMNTSQAGIEGKYHAFHIEVNQFRADEISIKKKSDELRG